MKRVLVYIDEDAVEDSIDLLEVGRLMYGAKDFCSYALAAGCRYGEAGNLFDHVFRVKNGPLPNYDSAPIVLCVPCTGFTILMRLLFQQPAVGG